MGRRYRHYTEEVESLELRVGDSNYKAVVDVLRKHRMNAEADGIASDFKSRGATGAVLNVRELSVACAEELSNVFRSGSRRERSILRAYIKSYKNPSAKIRKLELFPDILARYLAEDAIDGWIYSYSKLHGVHVAYVVTNILYHPGSIQSAPFVSLSMRANQASLEEHRGGEMLHKRSEHWDRHDVVGKTPFQILTEQGLLKETPELKETYLKEMALFEKYQPKDKKQFLCSVGATNANETNWWDRSHRDYFPLAAPTKMVNDEGILEREITSTCDNSFWHNFGVKSGSDLFSRVPVHPYILFYDLTRHNPVWVHANNCKPYKYDPTLRNKLVLPQKHRDLIDVLTTDLGVFKEDMIEGKSGGVPILCHGAPGLGKTLTAEVYAEITKRPLYRVHAGQLGTTLEELEKALEDILKRAERWGAVLLIDEADVYIRKRDNDIDHNAVVAAFLRTLEYFNGLLFLTTNRASDVDDAIASRMMAMFKYELPDADVRYQLWKVLTKELQADLPEKLIQKLVTSFPETSGRDIKQLLRLVLRYCRHHKSKPSLETFRICAMFRGLV